jgi:hypothetical protein
VLAAAVGALLIWSPTDVSAQQRGLDQAAIATANADAKAGWKNGVATGRRSSLPPGIAKNSAGSALPLGLRRLFGGAEPAVQPEPEPDPEILPEPQPEPDPGEQCSTDIVLIDGMLVFVDCNGNIIP